jgi:DNA-directed RNA polymerase subunit beta'
MEKIFLNQTLDKNTTKKLLSWFLDNYSELRLGYFLDEMKSVGFHFATKAGFSLGFDDLRIPDGKERVLKQTELEIFECENDFTHAKINSATRYQRLLAVWAAASESLKDEVTEYFEETDFLNPLYMMAFSGARGNISQVRQLIGMRGLMSDSSGGVIDFPIRSNFREGLSVTEYAISCYGARKGLIDTALRTADSGYLTRRLVDVAQKLVIGRTDCGTNEYFLMYDLRNEERCDPEALLIPAEDRVLGRLLGETLYFQDERISREQPYQPYAHPSDPSWQSRNSPTWQPTELAATREAGPTFGVKTGPADSFVEKTKEFSKISGKPSPRWFSTSVFKVNKGSNWVYKNFLPRDVFIRNPKPTRPTFMGQLDQPEGSESRRKEELSQPTSLAAQSTGPIENSHFGNLGSNSPRFFKTTRSLSFHRFSNPVPLTVIDYESRVKKERKGAVTRFTGTANGVGSSSERSLEETRSANSFSEIWPDQFEAISPANRDGSLAEPLSSKLMKLRMGRSGSKPAESEVGPGLLILRPIEHIFSTAANEVGSLIDGKPGLEQNETEIVPQWAKLDPRDQSNPKSKMTGGPTGAGPKGPSEAYVAESEIFAPTPREATNRVDLNTVISEKSAKFSGGVVREKKYEYTGSTRSKVDLIASEASNIFPTKLTKSVSRGQPRELAQALQNEENFQVYLLGVKNEEILPDLLEKVSEYREPDQGIPVRSALTCRPRSVDWNIGKNDDICQYCYGWNLATGRLVFIGEAVGILAAQSIGEPGTQLTMRTFHTGGVFSAEVEAKVFAPHGGFVSFSRKLPLPQFTTALGQKAFFITEELQVKISQRDFNSTSADSEGVNGIEANLTEEANLNFIQTYNENSIHENFQKTEGKKLNSILELPPYSYVFIFPGQKIERNQVCAEISKNSGIPRKVAETFTKSKPVRLEIQGQIGRPEEEVRLLQNGEKKWVSLFNGTQGQVDFHGSELNSSAGKLLKQVGEPEIGFNQEYIWVFSGKPVSYPRITQSCDYISPQIGIRDTHLNNLVGSKGVVSFEKKQNFSFNHSKKIINGKAANGSPRSWLAASHKTEAEEVNWAPARVAFDPKGLRSAEAANGVGSDLTIGSVTPSEGSKEELERSSLVSIQESENSNFLSFLTYFQSSQKHFFTNVRVREQRFELKKRELRQRQQARKIPLLNTTEEDQIELSGQQPTKLAPHLMDLRPEGKSSKFGQVDFFGSDPASDLELKNLGQLTKSVAPGSEFPNRSAREHLHKLAEVWFGTSSNRKASNLPVSRVQTRETGSRKRKNLATSKGRPTVQPELMFAQPTPLAAVDNKSLHKFFDSEEFESLFRRLLFFLETLEPIDPFYWSRQAGTEPTSLDAVVGQNKVGWSNSFEARSRFSRLSCDSVKPFSYLFWKDLQYCFEQKKISEKNSLFLRGTLTKILLSGVKHFSQFCNSFGQLWLQEHTNFDPSEEQAKLGLFGFPILDEPIYHERWNYSLFDRWNKYYWTKSIQLFWPQKKYSDLDPMLIMGNSPTVELSFGATGPDLNSSASGTLTQFMGSNRDSFTQLNPDQSLAKLESIYYSVVSLKPDFRSRLLFQLEVLFGERFGDDDVIAIAPGAVQGFRKLMELRALDEMKLEAWKSTGPAVMLTSLKEPEETSLAAIDLNSKGLEETRFTGSNPDSDFLNEEILKSNESISEQGFDEKAFEFHGKLGSHQKEIVDWEFRKWMIGGFNPSSAKNSVYRSTSLTAETGSIIKSRDLQSRPQNSWSFVKKLHQRGWSKEMVKTYVSADPFFEIAEVPLNVESKSKNSWSPPRKLKLKAHDEGGTFDRTIEQEFLLSPDEVKTAAEYEFKAISEPTLSTAANEVGSLTSLAAVDEVGSSNTLIEKPAKLASVFESVKRVSTLRKVQSTSLAGSAHQKFSPVEADKEFFLAVDLGETTRPFQREIEKEAQKYVKPKRMKFRQPELRAPTKINEAAALNSGATPFGGSARIDDFGSPLVDQKGVSVKSGWTEPTFEPVSRVTAAKEVNEPTSLAAVDKVGSLTATEGSADSAELLGRKSAGPEIMLTPDFSGEPLKSGQPFAGGDILEPDEYSEEGEITLKEVEFFERKRRNRPVFGEIGEIHTRTQGNPSDELLISRRHNFSRIKESQLPEYNFVQFTDLRLWDVPGNLLWVKPLKWENETKSQPISFQQPTTFATGRGEKDQVAGSLTKPTGRLNQKKLVGASVQLTSSSQQSWLKYPSRDRRLNWSKLPSIEKKLKTGLFDPVVFGRSLGELTVSGNPFQGMLPMKPTNSGLPVSRVQTRAESAVQLTSGLFGGDLSGLAENQISFDKSNQILRRTWLAKSYSLAYTLRLLHPYRTDFSRGNFELREKSLEVREGEILKSQEFLFSQTYEESRTGDIVQGLPKIEQLFEARRSSPFTLVTLHQELKKQFTYFCEKFPPLHAARLSLRFIQRVLVDEIQLIYHEQGVDIHDKHVELIVRQMTRRVAIRDSGTTHFLPSSVVEIDILERYAASRKNKFTQYKKYSSNLADTGLVIEPVILGLTKTSLVTTNFLSAASFQEARRMLFVAATKSSVDFLSELKHDVLVGRYLRAGSTFHGNTRLSSLQKRPGF